MSWMKADNWKSLSYTGRWLWLGCLVLGLIIFITLLPIFQKGPLVFRLPLISLVEKYWQYRQILSAIHEPQFTAKQICKITDFGAVGDGQTLVTLALQKAIDTCATKGGGTVIVPSGEFFSGPIRLKSHIQLVLEKNAILTFTDDRTQYLPPVFSRFQGMEYYGFSPFIYGKDLTDIAITGGGTLRGNGKTWIKWASQNKNDTGRKKLIDQATQGVPVSERIFGEVDALRPAFIEFVSSQNILIDGIRIEESPFWTIHPVYSDNVIIRNVTIQSTGMNTDGIVIDSSQDVLIEKAQIASGDDAIAIKSGLDQDGWRVGKSAENIIIRDVTVTEGHAGIAIGSEMSGGVHSVVIRDSIFQNTDTGINVKTLPGRGGRIDNIWLYHVTFAPVEIGIKLNMHYETEVHGDASYVPVLEDILFSRIRMTASKLALFAQGLGEHSLMQVSFVDVRSNIPTTDIQDTSPLGIVFSTFDQPE